MSSVYFILDHYRRHAETTTTIFLDGARLGTALEIANQGLAVFGQRAYTIEITAPGFIPRKLVLIANSAMPQRVFVDLVPIRTP